MFSFIMISPVNSAIKAKQREKVKGPGKCFPARCCVQAHVWSMSLFLGCFNASLDCRLKSVWLQKAN